MSYFLKKNSRDRAGFIVLMLIAAPCLFLGWKLFWFLTDDSFILFRYVSNSIQGFGYVWNPPPFQPVEGYTSFLWVVLLDVVWRLSGIAPPVSSNYLSLFFSYSTLVLISVMLMKLDWASSLRKYRLFFLSLFLVFILSNRTFLAWTSSGLETAMFCFFITLWVYGLIYIQLPVYRILCGSIAAVAIALTRPDGILFCAGTVLIATISYIRYSHKGKWHKTTFILALGPLILVILQFLWRYNFYGAWFPNTYYAKIDTPWPQSGAIYLFSFILEYGLWFFLIIVSWFFISALQKIRTKLQENGCKGTLSFLSQYHRLYGYESNIIVIFTLLGHFAYYTIIVGGDHFEYRVYNHLVPLIFLVLVWLLNHLDLKHYTVFIILISQIILSLPVQWTHWARTKDLKTRTETFVMRVPTAPAWPRPFSWYFSIFDKTQSWLISHFVCVRHQEHKIFSLTQLAEYPSRAAGMKISNTAYPVLAVRAVGIPSWVLPNVYILDGLGLNDYIIARTPINEKRYRVMAHIRRPPKGYIESYRPNVSIRNGKIEVYKRHEPLTESKIHQLESYWRNYIVAQRKSSSEVEKVKSIPTGNERILFIDEELLQAKRAKQLLEEQGYEVVILSSNIEALESIRKNPSYFDLIITDITIPEMTGKMLARELSHIRPDIPVMLSARFNEYPLLGKEIDSGGEFIIKPVEIEDFFTIRKVLDKTKKGSKK